MVNYANGKIYKIEPICEHDEGDVYVGSTTKQYLSQRMDNHRNCHKCFKNGKYHYVTIYAIFDKYGVENCRIFLLENCPCESKDQLHAREGFYIKSINCVNRFIAGRSHQEYFEQYKKENATKIAENSRRHYLKNAEKIAEYRIENAEEKKAYNKQYYIKNTEKIAEQGKFNREQNAEIFVERSRTYRENNVDKLKEKRKQSYAENKDIIKEKKKKIYDEKAKECFTCECGGKYTYNTKRYHFKTKLHLRFLSNQTEPTTL